MTNGTGASAAELLAETIRLVTGISFPPAGSGLLLEPCRLRGHLERASNWT